MTKPDKLFFQLVNTNADYIEFVVSYHLGEDHWTVDGIGWMNGGKPAYYLRLLRMNSAPASGKYYKKALIVEKNSSYKFENKVLNTFALYNVAQLLTTDQRKLAK